MPKPKPKPAPLSEQMAAPKPATAPVTVTSPTNANEVGDLPKNAVALLVWRKFAGAQPMTIVVTKESWEMNKKTVMDGGATFNPDRIYEFDSPTSPKGRKTIFHLQDVIGWAANLDMGAVSAPLSTEV